MSITCLNCGQSFEGNYCSNCGQKATVKRLTATVLLEDVLHFFTHLEHGFLLTTWNFLVRPGISSLHYVAGKRKDFQKPVSFFFIWTGLYILLHNTIVKHGHYQLTGDLVAGMDISEQSNIFFRQHFTLFLLPVLFVSAYILYLVLARPRYNFVEVLTLSLYGAGTYFMMSLVSDFVLGYILKVNILNDNVFLWQGMLSTIYNFWFSFDLFKRVQLRHFWLRLIGASILVAISGWILMFYLPMAWLYFSNH